LAIGLLANLGVLGALARESIAMQKCRLCLSITAPCFYVITFRLIRRVAMGNAVFLAKAQRAQRNLLIVNILQLAY
jgi:hypothetical protein